MNSLQKIFFFFATAIVLLLAGFFFFFFDKGGIEVSVDKAEYMEDDEMLVTIKNDFWGKEICLSSCYPYFLQRKADDWSEYKYKDCIFEDKIVECLSPKKTKTFRTSIPSVAQGAYRVSLPFCCDCNLGMIFKEEGRSNSGLFRIR